MSIVRIGLAENKAFADGYDAIFAKKKKPAAAPVATAKPVAVKKPVAKKSPAKKK
jgi:hypothetical protein